jgi:hypothetical protein
MLGTLLNIAIDIHAAMAKDAKYKPKQDGLTNDQKESYAKGYTNGFGDAFRFTETEKLTGMDLARRVMRRKQ